jgi:hypothetical protein
MSRVIQNRPAPSDIVTELWSGAPKQSHGTGDMRGCHGCTAKTRVSIIGSVIAGTSACARRGDVRFDPVTPIDYHRAAAAKVSNDILARSQRPDRVRCRVDSRRIHYSGTVWTVVARSRYHHYPSSSLSFDSGL